MTAVFSPTDLVLRDAAGRPVRDAFPLLAARDVAYLDHAASAQKPTPVLDAWRRFQETSYANVHRGACPISEEATDAYERARARVAAFLGVSADGLVFVRGATEGLNLAAYALLSGREGVPVALTELDHHANLVPWHFQGVGRGGRHRLVPVRVDASTGALSRISLSAAFDDAKIWALPHVSPAPSSSSTAARPSPRGRGRCRGGLPPTRSRPTRPTARRAWGRSGSSPGASRAGRRGRAGAG
jgi:selenocysteine lyase/cysteine desulfurase